MTVTGHQQRDISTQRLFITLGEIILKLFSKNYYMLHPHFLPYLLDEKLCIRCSVVGPHWLQFGSASGSGPSFDIIADPDGGSGSCSDF